MAGVLLLFVALSLVLTNPLALHLGEAVEDRQDALLNVWITAWDGHQLVSDPQHLFDANIFWPYPRTLAYSELLLGNGLLALPITAASGNSVLGHNVAVLLSFVLTGLGTYLLALRLTRSRGAGLVAGTVFAFCAYRMTNLAQAQLLTTQWMPLTLLALDHLVRHPRLRHVFTFVLFFSLQALSSFYYGMLLGLAVLGFVSWVAGSWAVRRVRRPASLMPYPSVVGGRPWSIVAHLFLASCLLLLTILPFAGPYFQVQREMGFERGLAESEPFSATLRQFLSVPPGSVIHGLWLPSENAPQAGGYPVDALFPGVTALALGVVGLTRGRGRVRWFFFLLLLASCLLSLGPRLYLASGRPAGLDVALPYAWLYAIMPGFKALRAPVRFDALAMLALAVLVGYGVVALERAGRGGLDQEAGLSLGQISPILRRPGGRIGIAAVLVALVALESLVWPAAHAEPVPVGNTVPSVYRWLAQQPPDPILELPMAFTAGGPQLETQYLSSYHWHPTPDGYSGFIPPKHGEIVYEMDRFPSERSVSLLQALGVDYVVIHTDRYPPDGWRKMEGELAQVADLMPVETFGPDRVYAVQKRALEPDGLEVYGYLPPHAAAGQPYLAYLIAVNHGLRSYAVSPTTRLRPGATWEAKVSVGDPRSAGALTQVISADVPLVTSPHGGAAVIPLSLTAPTEPGVYHLTLGEQGGVLGDYEAAEEVTVLRPDEMGSAPIPVPARLDSWTVPPGVRPGEPLSVSLTWRALGKIDAYFSVYAKLLDAAGNAVAGWDGQPQAGQAPTLLWVPGETISDSIALEIPAGTPPGDYTVEVGMYRAADLARVLTLSDAGWPVDHITLGTVRVGP